MRQLQRIPLSLLAISFIILPQLVQLVRDWYAFPLPYGTTLGPDDPDSWLRLTLVRELLNGGGWYNHAVTHSDVPYFQTVSPWTRPLDLVIAFFVKLQPSDVDLSLRLMRAALVLPVLWMGLLLVGICRAVRQLSPLPAAALVAVLLVACMPVMRNYFTVGNADHHALLAVVFVWAFGGILHSAPSHRLTILNGMLLALLLWISPEGMTLIAAVYGWYGILWLAGDKAQAAPLPLLTVATAFSAIAAVAIERPPQEWLVPLYDSMSVVYAVILTCIAFVTVVLFRLDLATRLQRVGAAGIGIYAVAAYVLTLYPAMIDGPLTGLDPYIYSDFLPRIMETQPLWQKEAFYVAATCIYPLAALVFFCLAWRMPGSILPRPRLLMLGYFIAATFGLFVHQQRFFYYFGPVVIIALAPFIAALLTPEHPLIRQRWPARWLACLPPSAQASRRIPLLALIVGLPLLLLGNIPDQDTEQSRKVDACSKTVRRMIHHGALNQLAGDKPLTIFMATNFGGEALFFTPHRIIASNYHREGSGIRYVWEADKILDIPTLKEYLAQRKVDALVICPVPKPIKHSALERLRQGERPPSWLIPAPYPAPPLQKEEKAVEGSAPAIFLVRHKTRE